MCTTLTLPEELRYGDLVELCSDYSTCPVLRDLLDLPRHDPDPKRDVSDSLDFLDCPKPRTPARDLFAAFDAKTAIIEDDYFDMDYRSEFSATQETSFTVGYPDATRIHFFSRPAPPPGPDRSMARFRDAVASASKSSNPSKSQYRGYAVIRSTEQPTFGRSLVSPFRTRADIVTRGGHLYKHIRTAVYEPVQLFGVTLPAFGVPFMEQDGALLRCSHVTAWMAHFTAVLHGLVPRRVSARFSSDGNPSRSYGRSFPSQGLTTRSQSDILDRLDLPCEVIFSNRLGRERDPAWYDREALVELAQSLRYDQGTPNAEQDRKDEESWKLWFVENLTSSVARYLNSGFPVILNAGAHSFLVCGYLRQQDLVRPAPPTNSALDRLDVTTLIVQDDQVGPFQTVNVRELALRSYDDPAYVTVVVPLPAGLWLSGEAAEAAAADLLAGLIPKRYAALRRRDPSGYADGDFEAMRLALKDLKDAVGPKPTRSFAMRSYATSAYDFKRDFAQRIGHIEAADLVCYATLPKYVWVVEVLRRRDRDHHFEDGEDPDAKINDVVATVVMDGSAVSDDGIEKPPSGILVHIPGQISYLAPSPYTYREANWVSTHAKPYETGRWTQKTAGFNDPVQFALRAKAAVALGH
nr:hypothetical protein [Propionicimonas sp.]